MTNDEGMKGNDEARMTNDELMTKSKTPREQFDEGFWNDDAGPVIREEPSDSRVYDLEERTARFGEAVIDFVKTIPQDAVTNASLTSSWVQRQVWERITLKPTTRCPKENF